MNKEDFKISQELTDCSVSLHIYCVTRVHTGRRVDPFHQSRLGIWIREGDACRFTVLIQSRVSNNCVDRVASRDGIVQALENDCADTFTSCIPGTSTIEDEASTMGVHHAMKY
jgi:hypothetical protein